MINFVKKETMAATQQHAGAMYNSLTVGSKIVGTITTDNDIRVDGTIEGDVNCAGKLVVGEKGVVLGTVVCQNAEVMGCIDGKIEVKQSLALRATSRVKGEIYAQTLTVEPNAIFNGTCVMGKTSKDKN
jgi:cytoskeletal protein CcmA (bactofilin family)